MTDTHGTAGRNCTRRFETRFDRMYRSLPFRQQLLLWAVTITVGLQVPPLVVESGPPSGVLTVVLVLGLFALQSALFWRYNRR